jgi:hypothetical protein
MHYSIQTYDESFRDWHKLDWHLNDFSVWGHSFDKLLSPAKYFTTNPTFLHCMREIVKVNPSV